MYLNPNNQNFQMMINSDIYVDKSLLIQYTNHRLSKSDRFLCVYRPRRFGKSTDANMLVAYYSQGCDSSYIFDHLKIKQTDLYQKHLNQHHVIYLNMQNFLSMATTINDMLELLSEEIIEELGECFQVKRSRNILSLYLFKIFSQTNKQFIFIIDEWDCIFREYVQDKEAQKKYLDFLRNLLKDQPYVELVYMTGILPIKKYGTYSALNMFKEISMINLTPLEEFMGFTETEVQELCQEYQMNYLEMKEWYDGYNMEKGVSIYNHRSVIYALMDKKYENYWTNTETYEALKVYIDMNFDGLRDDVVRLINDEKIKINISKFQNNMTTFESKDDVFYITYSFRIFKL